MNNSIGNSFVNSVSNNIISPTKKLLKTEGNLFLKNITEKPLVTSFSIVANALTSPVQITALSLGLLGGAIAGTVGLGVDQYRKNKGDTESLELGKKTFNIITKTSLGLLNFTIALPFTTIPSLLITGAGMALQNAIENHRQKGDPSKNEINSSSFKLKCLKMYKLSNAMCSRLTSSSSSIQKESPVSSNSFSISGNSRNGQEDLEIKINIGKCDHLDLTEENLGEIFKIANQHTLNVPYPCATYENIVYEGQVIHRPNHNGTHSVRQVRCLELLFDLIEKKGTPNAKNQLHQLTSEQKLNLKLAAYFLRAGRVDESSHAGPKPDDYYTRSALIYEAYARQLKINEEEIQWTKKIIIDSCKPENLCEEAFKQNNLKSNFAYDLLTSLHELDLVRCFRGDDLQRNVDRTQKRIGDLIEAEPQDITKQLYDFSRDLCRKTGTQVSADEGYGFKNPVFGVCSLDGAKCLNEVRTVNIPIWN